jgi:hypothetical protein
VRALGVAGVVHQDVERSPRRLRRRQGGRQRCRVGHVGAHEAGGGAFRDHSRKRRLGAAEHGDAHARPGQRGGDRGADAAPAAGDERMPPARCHVRPPRSRAHPNIAAEFFQV